jgi:hypothetical protein
MPVEPVVLGQWDAAAQAERLAELAVERIALRRQHRDRVGTSFEEDADEDRLRRSGRGSGDAFLERRDAEARRAVDGEHRAEALRDERPTRQARACR